MTLIAVLVAIVALFLLVLSVVVNRLLYICSPNEVLIFSGGQRASSGRSVGYRVIKGGRAIRLPLLEAVDRMDLTNMPIEVSVKGAYSKGGIPLNVHGIANLKIAGEPPVLDNAVERFLGVDRNQIMMVAKEALEECRLANHVRFVEDGVELLAYLRRQGRYSDPDDTPRPGLILLDLNMPRKDGREALREIKADPALKNIRVVVLTTSKAEEDVLRSYKLHANCYITKPVDLGKFIVVVQSIDRFWLTVVTLPPAKE